MVAIRFQQQELPAESPLPRASGSGPVLSRAFQGGSGPSWVLEPYAGVEPGSAAGVNGGWVAYGCGAPRSAAVQILVEHLRGVARRRDRSFAEHPVRLGLASDPWQPAERELQLTRRLLAALAAIPGLELHGTTKSSLIGRDVDLLAAIARTGRLRVEVSLSSLERRVWTLLEPGAPSPERRLMAVGLLARAGIPVGLEVAPVLRGVNDSEEGWLALLQRARDAGASHASLRTLSLTGPARERLTTFLAAASPERAVAARRLVASAHLHDLRGRAELVPRFEEVCRRAGLACANEQVTREAAAAAPRQLSLF